MKKKKDAGLHVPGTYVKIPDGMLVSKDFNNLKPTARCVYMVMLAKWNPYSPEEAFSLPYDELRAITSFGPNTISDAIKKLMINGYIKIPHKGRYPNNVSMYKIDLEPLQRKYKKVARGKGTWPEYIEELKNGVE